MNKLKALAHLVIHKAKDPMRLGAIRLNKALWFSDVYAYKLRGAPITPTTYVKRERGPVPYYILPALRELVSEGAISIEEPQFPLDPRKYRSLKPPPEGVFDEWEDQLVESILNGLTGLSASAVSDMSHCLAWELATEGEQIPLYATLAETPGEYTPEVMEWARKSVPTPQAA